MQLSDEASKELTLFIESEGRAWAERWIADRKAFLNKRKVSASGSLVDSLQYELQSTLGNEIKTTLSIAFDEHGRYIDMKRLNVPDGGSDLILALQAWIVRKNLQSKFESGFLKKRKLKTLPQDALNRMAWGIAINRSKIPRRKAWYAKAKAAGIDDLYNRIAAGLPQIVADEITKNFPKN
jgi:hypothetical protein